MQWQRVWFFKRRIPEPTQFFALGVLYLWARIPNNQFLIGQPMGTADQWLSSEQSPRFAPDWFKQSANQPQSSGGATRSSPVVGWPMIWWFKALCQTWWPQLKLSAILKIHLFVYALKSDGSFDSSLQLCGCLFFGDRFIGQQALIRSQTFLYLITWYLFYTRFSKNTWTPKMKLFLIKYLLSWFNKIN